MAEIIKHAKLFEAGRYEDKGLDVTEGDLDEIVGASGDVPLTVGHLDPGAENPLRLGTVGQLRRKGRELFGVIRFLPEAWALVTRSGARRLSVCLDSVRKKLVEVSLVVHPRVEDARVRFDGETVDYATEFDVGLDERSSEVRRVIYDTMGAGAWVSEVFDGYAIVEDGAKLMKVPYALAGDGVTLGSPQPVERRYVPLSANETRFDARLVEAMGREREALRLLREERAGAAIERWKADGRLAPAAESCAQQLMAAGGATAEAFIRFMDCQPAGLLLRELVPFAGEGEALPELDTEEMAFCERLGIGVEEYRRMKARPLSGRVSS